MVVRIRLSDQQLAQPLADIDTIVASAAPKRMSSMRPCIPRKQRPTSGVYSARRLLACSGASRSIYTMCDVWLDGDNPHWPPPASRHHMRNKHWRHLNSMRVLAMPDKWEYPWFAAWDLAFHCVTLALVDAEFAKEQLWLLLFEQFQHPNGQIPAYEWEFSDLNPPVHAWAVWRVYNMDRIRSGRADRLFLETVLSQAADQFCLVGQQGGQLRATTSLKGVSRARQHHRH